MEKEINDLVCPRCFRSHQLHNHYYGKTICEDGFEICSEYPYNNNFVVIKVFPLIQEVIDALAKSRIIKNGI